MPDTIQCFIWIPLDLISNRISSKKYENNLEKVLNDLGQDPIYLLYGAQSNEEIGFGVYYKGERIV